MRWSSPCFPPLNERQQLHRRPHVLERSRTIGQPPFSVKNDLTPPHLWGGGGEAGATAAPAMPPRRLQRPVPPAIRPPNARPPRTPPPRRPPAQTRDPPALPANARAGRRDRAPTIILTRPHV